MLKTTIGDIELDICTMNASGCRCTSSRELDDLYLSECGAVVSKSSTVESRIGNVLPRFYQDEIGTINSMGIPNFGYEYYMNYCSNISNGIHKPFIQSVIPLNLDDMKIILYDINKSYTGKTKIVELNLSCPNLINKSIVGLNFEDLEVYLNNLNQMSLENITLGLKLPPYYETQTFEQVSNLILKYQKNIKFITVINSVVNGLLIDVDTHKTRIKPKNGYGGIGGDYCRPIALANVNQFYNLLGDKISIIGCGGISKGIHVFEHILCGASAVQIGSQLVKEGPNCFTRINEEFRFLMNKHGYKHITDFIGKVTIC